MSESTHAFLSGIVIGGLLVAAGYGLRDRGALEEYGIKTPVRTEYIYDDVKITQAKLYLVQRMGRPSYVRMTTEKCLKPVLDMMTGRTQTWKDAYCAQTYKHLVYFYDKPNEDPQGLFYVQGVVEK